LAKEEGCINGGLNIFVKLIVWFLFRLILSIILSSHFIFSTLIYFINFTFLSYKLHPIPSNPR
jgi:hypothetical protein